MSDISSDIPTEAVLPDQEQSRRCQRFFYGWIMLPITTLGVMCSAPGQTFSVSTFNNSLRGSLDLSQTAFGLTYTIGTLLAALPMTYVGALMDRFGPRRVMTGVVFILGLGCFFISKANSLPALLIGFFMLRLFGQGSMTMLSTNTLALWFNKKLGSVNAIRNQGMNLTIAILPTINLWLISELGWRWTFRILGLGVWAVMFPVLLLFFRNRPEDVGQLPDGELEDPLANEDNTTDDCTQVNNNHESRERDFRLSEAIRTRAYWIILAGVAMWAMTVTAVIFQVQPLLTSRGLDEDYVGHILAVLAATLAVSQLITGYLADRIGLNYLLSVGMLMLAASVWILKIADTLALALTFAVAMGLAQGIVTSINSPFWVRYFGRKHLGKIQGSVTTTLVGASSLGASLLGVGFDLFGSYDQVLLMLFFLPLPLVILALLATKPPLPAREKIPAENKPA